MAFFILLYWVHYCSTVPLTFFCFNCGSFISAFYILSVLCRHSVWILFLGDILGFGSTSLHILFLVILLWVVYLFHSISLESSQNLFESFCSFDVVAGLISSFSFVLISFDSLLGSFCVHSNHSKSCYRPYFSPIWCFHDKILCAYCCPPWSCLILSSIYILYRFRIYYARIISFFSSEVV